MPRRKYWRKYGLTKMAEIVAKMMSKTMANIIAKTDDENICEINYEKIRKNIGKERRKCCRKHWPIKITKLREKCEQNLAKIEANLAMKKLTKLLANTLANILSKIFVKTIENRGEQKWRKCLRK